MSIFTTAERHRIYQKALHFYKDHVIVDGLCEAISMAIFDKTGKNMALHIIPAHFPEFAAYKPDPIDMMCGAYWWPINDTQTRCAVLKCCIEQTDSKYETKYHTSHRKTIL